PPPRPQTAAGSVSSMVSHVRALRRPSPPAASPNTGRGSDVFPKHPVQPASIVSRQSSQISEKRATPAPATGKGPGPGVAPLSANRQPLPARKPLRELRHDGHDIADDGEVG